MPTAPRLPERRIQPAPLPDARMAVDAPPEAFGGGTERIVNEAERLGVSIQQIALEEKRKADDVAVVEADAKATAEATRLQLEADKVSGEQRDRFTSFQPIQPDDTLKLEAFNMGRPVSCESEDVEKAPLPQADPQVDSPRIYQGTSDAEILPERPTKPAEEPEQ